MSGAASRPLPDDAAAFLREHLGEEWTAQPLHGDASVRAYFRIVRADGSTFMLAYYPEEVRPQLGRYLASYRALAAAGARPPELFHHSDAATLQYDVGDRTLFDVLHEDRVEGVRLYRKAIDLLVAFQQSPAGEINPPFSAEFFAQELEMSRDYYVERLMGERGESLAPLFQTLARNVAAHPYVLCHRDFHGQNIHVVGDEIYLIDFQDLRMGPDTYDLASLLRDRGVARIIGDETELELVDHYAGGRNVRHRYFETLLQRSIKILGTFSKQPIERGRMHYLDFIPPTIESIRRCLRELPEYAALERLLPMEFSVNEAKNRIAERRS